MKFFTYGSFCAAKKARIISWLKGLDPAIKRMIIMRINLVAFLISITIMNVCASVHAQNISLNFKQATITEVLAVIKKQSGYQFLYNETEIKRAKPVSIVLKDAALKEALDQVFKDQPLHYQILDKTIVVKEKKGNDSKTKGAAIEITGKVIDQNNSPIPGVTVKVEGTDIVRVTGTDGLFNISLLRSSATLIVSCVGYTTKEVNINNSENDLLVVLEQSTSQLDQVQVIGYGTSSRRLNTGSVAKVSSAEIAQQTVSNPLQILGGRVPGMFVQSNGGMAGSNLNIQIRGVNSIAAGNNPLYIIDGVPFGSGAFDQISASLNTNFSGGLSPFNTLNPSDIESIEILKDADATAIYGSRGANGVVLITTKKGKDNDTRLSVNLSQGYGKVPRFIDMLSTAEYLQLRTAAFSNSNTTPTAVNAPDLITWDNNRDVNWQKELIGGVAGITDAQASFSGGNAQTRFVFSGSYRNEGSVISSAFDDRKGTARLNVDHTSPNNRLMITATFSYSSDKNSIVTDPTPSINLPPNYPIYNANGRVIYRPGIFTEPYGILQTPFNNQTNSFLSNAVISYNVWQGLKFRTSLGYSQIDLNQVQKFPAVSQDPVTGLAGYAYFGENHVRTWIAEPQLNYQKALWIGKIDALVGMTFQQTASLARLFRGLDYSSDALLDNIASAGTLSVSRNTDIDYRYVSVFGRINYNLTDKYILNATFRRDGSSRFGSGRRFGNFGAVGAAWIFSDEAFVKESFPVLSYGKLRGSYGITGNDQITDYQYLASYTATSNSYQIPGLRGSRIANPDYSWETNRKLEFAADLGFLRDRILLSVAYYRNRSGNMLVSYPLSGQTGFTSYQANLPAEVQNTGWELLLNTINIKKTDLNWSTAFNITLPKNKLLTFPGIEKTSYGTNNLVVGQSLNLLWGYRYQGVDPQTGLALVEDIDHNGTISTTGDYANFGTTLPKFYGGFSNTLNYKGFQADILFQFANKVSMTPLRAWLTVPGSIRNIPAEQYSEIWKQAGDNAEIPKALIAGTTQYILSGKGYEDASYIKLKSISLGYNFNSNWTKKWSIQKMRIYLQAQNLLTVTSFSGLDPEASSPVVLPNLRIITTGIQIDL